MERQLILVHLAAASRHAADDERHVANQRDLVEQMRRNGQDASVAEQVLREFEQSLAKHIADRERLEKQLAETSI
jgi:hypothetical protein